MLVKSFRKLNIEIENFGFQEIANFDTSCW
jgi:hypothetical protein